MLIKVVYAFLGMLVGSDDPLWTCLCTGSFARLTLRHLPLIQTMMTQRAHGIKPFATYYKVPRRLMMQEFVEALANEGQNLKKTIASSSPVLSGPILIADLSKSIAASLYVVMAMMNGNSTEGQIRSAMAVVASAAAHDLLMVTTQREGVQSALGQFRFQIQAALREIDNFPSRSKDESNGAEFEDVKSRCQLRGAVDRRHIQRRNGPSKPIRP